MKKKTNEEENRKKQSKKKFTSFDVDSCFYKNYKFS